MILNNRFCALLVALAMPLFTYGQEIDQQLLRLAKGGDPKAMYEVGMSYFNKGDKKGFDDAYYWFLKSAEKDYAPSEVMTAFLLKSGVVESDDPNGAWKWAQKAMGEGDGLGAWLISQICLEREFQNDLVLDYVEKASERSYPLAKLLLAKLYATGNSDYQIRKDITKSRRILQELRGCDIPIVSAIVGAQLMDNPQQAFRNLKIAADAGIPAAMSQVANMYYNGVGVTKSVSEAFKYYQMAAEKNDPLGMEGLADCYRTGTGTGIFHERAFNLYNKIGSSNPRVAYILGNYYNEGISVAKDQKKAISLFENAALGGDVFALALLGIAYYDGSSPVGSKDFNKAYSYLSTAQKNKDFSLLPDETAAVVLERLARCYRFGRGGAPENRKEAEKWQAKSDELKGKGTSSLPFASMGLIPFSDSKERCGISWDSKDYENILEMITFDYPKDYLESGFEPKVVETPKPTPPPVVEQKVEPKQDGKVNQVKSAKLTPAKSQSGGVAFFLEAAPIGFGPSSVISSKDDNTYWLKGQVTEISASIGWLKESGFIGGGVAYDMFSGGRMSIINGFVDIRYTNGNKKKSGFVAGARAGVAYGTNDLGIGINATGTLGYKIPLGGNIAIDLGVKAGITIFSDEAKTKAGLAAPFVGFCF